MQCLHSGYNNSDSDTGVCFVCGYNLKKVMMKESYTTQSEPIQPEGQMDTYNYSKRLIGSLLTAINLATILFLAACAPRMDITPAAPPDYQTILSPPIGETASAQVGDTIITMAHTLSSPAIEFLNDCSFSEKFDRPGTGTVEYKVSKGAIFTQDNISNGVPAYCGQTSQYAPPIGWVPVRHCVAISGGNLIPFPQSEMIVQSDCRVVAKQVTMEAQDSFKREILYDGKSGTTIHLSYREFARDMARPAFTQELYYDIRDDRVIGFKGARFEVIDANNTGIRYRVLSGF
ncbi:MAG: hypothetical protein ABSG91_10580 [Syntrophobacteraceae bacterium]|jgi:hypothetical protein